jgi:hypothetical protein
MIFVFIHCTSIALFSSSILMALVTLAWEVQLSEL